MERYLFGSTSGQPNECIFNQKNVTHCPPLCKNIIRNYKRLFSSTIVSKGNKELFHLIYAEIFIVWKIGVTFSYTAYLCDTKQNTLGIMYKYSAKL